MNANEEIDAQKQLTNTPSLVKQQQQQLKQQLAMSTPRAQLSTNHQTRFSTDVRRAILYDNTNILDNEAAGAAAGSSTLKALRSDSGESLDEQDEQESQQKRAPVSRRIVFNPSDLNSELGKDCFTL